MFIACPAPPFSLVSSFCSYVFSFYVFCILYFVFCFCILFFHSHFSSLLPDHLIPYPLIPMNCSSFVPRNNSLFPPLTKKLLPHPSAYPAPLRGSDGGGGRGRIGLGWAGRKARISPLSRSILWTDVYFHLERGRGWAGRKARISPTYFACPGTFGVLFKMGRGRGPPQHGGGVGHSFFLDTRNE